MPWFVAYPANVEFPNFTSCVSVPVTVRPHNGRDERLLTKQAGGNRPFAIDHMLNAEELLLLLKRLCLLDRVCLFLMLWTAPPPASRCAKLRLIMRSSELPELAHNGSATGVSRLPLLGV